MTTAANGTDWLSTLAGLYSGYQSNQAGSTISNDVSSLMDRLNESYTNPQGVFDTQYSALDKAFYNDLQAQNAQAGRATDAYKTGVAREAAFQNWLSQYRQGLVNNAQGLASNRTTAANAEGQGIYALQSLLGGGTRPSTGTGTGSTAGSLLSGIGSAASGAGDWLSSLFNYGNTADGQNVVNWYNTNYGDYVDPSVEDPVMQLYYDQGESSDTSWMDYWS